jgi:hypothetical protein
MSVEWDAENHRRAHWLYWITKGHLDTTEEQILSSHDSYLRRAWGNIENYVHEEGFKEAYAKKETSNGRVDPALTPSKRNTN